MVILFISHTLGEKFPYLEFFWSAFFHIQTEYGPEKLNIQTLFTQWYTIEETVLIKRTMNKTPLKTKQKINLFGLYPDFEFECQLDNHGDQLSMYI